MANSHMHPQGWISVSVPERHEKRAKQIRAERDQQYGNIYSEAETDERWVGDLGEIVFNSWFKYEGIKNLKWILNNTAGQPDFVTELNTRIGVKTVKRKVPPLESYTAQITARHANEPIDQFFFMTYELPKRRMWLLGGIERTLFLQEARYYNAGEWVHEHYQIRKGHEIYNIGFEKLVTPKNWLECVARGGYKTQTS